MKTVTDNKSAAKPTKQQMYKKNIIYLTIEDETGKTFRKKAAETPITPKSDSEAYKVGDTVLHLHGTDMPLYSLPRQTRVATVLCAAAQMTKWAIFANIADYRWLSQQENWKNER